MNIKQSIVHFMLIIGMMSCIESIDFKSRNAVDMVYIDGFLTDDFGYQSLVVGELLPFSKFDNPPIADADVYIEASDNATYFFNYFDGEYISTTQFAAQEGVEYELHVIIDGVEYVSTPQSLSKGQEIKNYTFRESSAETLKYNGEIEVLDGITLSIDMDNPDGDRKYYKISTEHTYVFEAYRRQEGHPYKRCYNYEPPASFDLHENSQTDYTYDLGFFPFGREFEYEISILVTQVSMNQDAFQFWSEVQLQGEHTGSIFDTPPYTIRGNMTTDDPENRIRGFFSVYDINSERMFLSQHDLSYEWDPTLNDEECYPPRGWPDRHCFNCLSNKLASDRTNIKPPWWP